jgi:hypothetical protein
MKKIKKPHKCENHLAPVTRLFLGYEEKPLALMEQDKLIAKWGMLVQCTFCKTIGVIPLQDADQGKKHECDCGDDCKCKEKDAEGKETKEG